MRPCLKASLVAAGKSDSKFGLRNDSSTVWKLRFLIKTVRIARCYSIFSVFQSSHSDCIHIASCVCRRHFNDIHVPPRFHTYPKITSSVTRSVYCNTHIVQYLTKQRQPDNETWWINRIEQEKYVSSKIMPKIRQWRLVPDLFLCLRGKSKSSGA